MNPITLPFLWIAAVPLSLLIVVAIRNYALRRAILDIPNGRSSHSVPTPRGGGVGIVGATLALFLLGSVNQTDISATRVAAFLAAGITIAIIGLIDDWWKTLSAKMRLVTHFAVALVFIVITGAITKFYIPTLDIIALGQVLGGGVTLLWVVGSINAFNFMDGSDGLAGTQAFLAGITFALLFFLEGQETLALLAGLIAASSLGFLVLNAPPAKIFMGDVGSTFLGFALGALTVIAYTEMRNPRLLVSAGLIVGVFVFDTTFTILRRIRNGENLLEAHCSHLYQRLIRLGYSHGTVCVRYAFLMALSGVSGLLYYFAENESAALGALVVIAALYVGLAGWVTWLEATHAARPKTRIRLASTQKLEIDK